MVVLMNQLISLPFGIFLFYLMSWRGFPAVRELPTFHWVLLELAVFILTEEIGFYYSHR